MGTINTARKKRLWWEEVIRRMKEMGISLDYEKTISHFCEVHDSTRKTALEFIKLNINMGKIRLKRNKKGDMQILHNLISYDGDLEQETLFRETEKQLKFNNAKQELYKGSQKRV